MKEKNLLGYYNYTVILTYMGMLMGFMGITLILDQAYTSALLCLMIAGICDMFDGTVAATKERNRSEKNFGIQIDSLSDLICFGVFPALFVYQICDHHIGAFLVSCFYVLNALIRLAYFNVTEEERQQSESGARQYYQGLPVTTAALILPAFYLIFDAVLQIPIQMIAVVIGVMGLLFVTPFQIKKPHIVGKISVCIIGILEFALVVMGVLGAS